jgi:hypothetical protein
MSAAELGSERSRSRLLAVGVPLALYVAFAALVYWVQGPAPELSIDHIAYFKLADELRAKYPAGDYWRGFDALRSYSIGVAYLYDVTGSHIESLKLLMAGMTVAYLVTFEQLLFFFTRRRALSVIFSLLSAQFVSFGAAFWGFTDFAASLHRTLILPIFVLVIWFFLRFRASPWRYATYPFLVLISLIHLSSYYLLLVLLAYEALEFVFIRKLRIDRRLAYFALGIVGVFAARELLTLSGRGFTKFVDRTLELAFGAADSLTPAEAWRIELYAFPWRNFPIPVTTLANIALSYGSIFVLSVAGAIAARRREGWNDLDRIMIAFAAAVVAASYGLQTLLWVLRSLTEIYPINFEEIRAISLLMIPSLYFVTRLVALLWWGERRRVAAAAVVLLFVLQPILLLRSLPVSWREGLIERMAQAGVLPVNDSIRLLYARQYLGLAYEGPRFYYSTLGVLDWLHANASPDDRVMTDRNEIPLAGLPVVGAFQRVMMMTVTVPARREWKEQLDQVAEALATHDRDMVMKTARELHATLVIVPWQEPDALYRDENFSLLRVE